MPASRRYKLLCPIARGLDRVGDRWTLLILRDLHAGPARFSGLQAGLTGIASNLLTDRLQQMTDDGLIEKREGDHGVALYALTGLGARTRDVLFELAMFGSRFPPDDDMRRPGNLRTIAVTLAAACQRAVAPQMQFEAGLEVDGEAFTLSVRNGKVDVRYAYPASPDVEMKTSYEPMIAASDGDMPVDEFVRKHVEITRRTPGKDAELMTLLGSALARLRGEDRN